MLAVMVFHSNLTSYISYLNFDIQLVHRASEQRYYQHQPTT
ncbi:UNVERIFIED_CONTAM: hypothetical protein ABIC26_004990 [Paenibacillus sp. PvR008]